ncbi:hypothetical protein ABZ359_34320 [Streptomyces sp. NPDC005968]|uniref:hypothetical protein n=1 Tax=Streptomyces sp. NPDC005968 TaxID=3154574 RepID=UPI003411579C
MAEEFLDHDEFAALFQEQGGGRVMGGGETKYRSTMCRASSPLVATAARVTNPRTITA